MNREDKLQFLTYLVSKRKEDPVINGSTDKGQLVAAEGLPPLVCEPHTETAEVLQCALDILSDSRRWTKNSYHRLVRVASSDPEKPDAIERGQFCLVGAIEHCTRLVGYVDHDRVEKMRAREDARALLISVLASRTTHAGVETFNDDSYTQHSDIISLLTDALDIAKSREGRVVSEGATYVFAGGEAKGSADGETNV